jgi:hypothetical protein
MRKEKGWVSGDKVARGKEGKILEGEKVQNRELSNPGSPP